LELAGRDDRVIRLLLPLNLGADEADEAVAILRVAVAEVSAGLM
jgi:4-aminobutyrate aminotransferase-like enzyme